MAQERTSHGRWAEAQRQALIDAGVNPLDADLRIDWILAHVPDGVDPATWVPGGSDLDEELGETQTIDANAVFMASRATPTNYRRLLSAKEEIENAS